MYICLYIHICMCIILYSNLIQLHSYFVYTGYLGIPNLSHNAPEQIDLSNKLLTGNYERIICYSYSYNKLPPHMYVFGSVQ